MKSETVYLQHIRDATALKRHISTIMKNQEGLKK
jgi:hypothetical protein